VFAFHDFDAAVAGREGVTVLGDPGRSDKYALGGVLVFHDAGRNQSRSLFGRLPISETLILSHLRHSDVNSEFKLGR